MAMPQRTDTFELAPLGLRSGDGRRLDLHVAIDAFHYAGEPYAVTPPLVPVRVDVVAHDGQRAGRCGCASRAGLEGPCMRCLEPAAPEFEVDVREVSQPGGGDELSSPYVGRRRRAAARAVGPRRARARAAGPADLPGGLRRALRASAARTSTSRTSTSTRRRPDPRWAKLGELKFD